MKEDLAYEDRLASSRLNAEGRVDLHVEVVRYVGSAPDWRYTRKQVIKHLRERWPLERDHAKIVTAMVTEGELLYDVRSDVKGPRGRVALARARVPADVVTVADTHRSPTKRPTRGRFLRIDGL